MDTKTCNKCGEPKPMTEYHRRTTAKDGHRNHCKACQRRIHDEWYADNKDRRVDANRIWRANNADRYRDTGLMHKYGITGADYDVMVAAQGGVCAICKQPPPADNRLPGNRVLHVDHCHATGQVRGLLCHSCNKSLGQIGDANLAAAAAYIERAMEAGQ
ncbi:endonuclease VII domain-containing protein [Mycolicibacter arupensis]|jgi:hypothetical protein|uniref:Recombination endonuclease VII n=1 Tax=Mycolicibacter arupensis TaxID=342002 RepID=A0A5C7YEF8_9MYCO|nr:endonuclease VII domain-containing protein [Mycolicibacter arupensis]TXI59966.1 MAG: hypothetical protein E6Q54_01470 [Mycolicibacter arupensis]